MSKVNHTDAIQGIERFLAEATLYTRQTIEEEQVDPVEITLLAIRAFNGIVAMCQEELSESDGEHLRDVLLGMCRIDVDANSELLCEQIQGFVSHHIGYYRDQKEEDDLNSIISESNILKLIRMKEYGNKLRHLLQTFTEQNKKRRWYQFYRSESKHRWAEEALAKVDEALDKINQRIEHDSDKMIQKIVDNFYIIYIALLGLIKYAKFMHDLTLELTVNAQIDRILNIIDPSFKAHALKNKYLLYYNVVYELKELHSSVLSDM